MANDNSNRLPIKVVMSREQDKVKNIGGGSKKFFEKVTPQLRNFLADKFYGLNDFYKSNFNRYPKVPCVGKIKVKEDAIAKSHKPNNLLNEETCPIIGSNKLDEILIKLTDSGIEKIINEILNNDTNNFKANLTVINDIFPYTEEDIFKGSTKNEILENIVSYNSIKTITPIKSIHTAPIKPTQVIRWLESLSPLPLVDEGLDLILLLNLKLLILVAT